MNRYGLLDKKAELSEDPKAIDGMSRRDRRFLAEVDVVSQDVDV